MKHYSVYGLNISSEFELLGARTTTPSPVPDVVVTRTSLDLPSSESFEDGRYSSATMYEALLAWEKVGCIRILSGKEIQVAPIAGIPDAVVSLFITGVAMGVLLHQRGFLVLHASAVRIQDKVAAFIGFKGMGKSTTAAAMVGQGASLVSDDILAIDGDFLARPGSDLVKLWPRALSAALEDDPEESPALYPGIEKRAKVFPDSVVAEPFPLRAIYVLDSGNTVSIQDVAPAAAFLEIMRHTYAPRFVGTDGTPPELFAQCTRLVSQIPVFRLHRKPDLAELSSVAVAVESHFSDLLVQNE
ncbi:MAG: hypothetical protein HKN43_12595 [Rhodothermales bacterium]|nr:hypothetical protein [Rhodothermales bacterium]